MAFLVNKGIAHNMHKMMGSKDKKGGGSSSMDTGTDIAALTAFKYFDKDGNGYIESPEAHACVVRVFEMIGMKAPSEDIVSKAFKAVGGADGKVDMMEFLKVVNKVMELLGLKEAKTK